ncbi:11572_t:CDS:2, partial [Funneliformis mosseae]
RNYVVDNQNNVENLLNHERLLHPRMVFLIIVRLLTELLRRIKKASIKETMHQISDDLQKLKTNYQQSIQHHTANAKTRQLII